MIGLRLSQSVTLPSKLVSVAAWAPLVPLSSGRLSSLPRFIGTLTMLRTDSFRPFSFFAPKPMSSGLGLLDGYLRHSFRPALKIKQA